METAKELAMSPEIHERIAVAESNIKTTQADVSKILGLVEKMPHRLTRRMKRLLQECRSSQAATHTPKQAQQGEDRDWGQTVRNIVIVAGVIGGLVGGAYQAVKTNDRPAITQSQGGK